MRCVPWVGCSAAVAAAGVVAIGIAALPPPARSASPSPNAPAGVLSNTPAAASPNALAGTPPKALAAKLVAPPMTPASVPGASTATSPRFDCLIEPSQVVEVRSPVVGLIERVHARRGDLIRKGQVLVTIESSVERSAADAARFRAEAQGAMQHARNKVLAAREKARRVDELQRENFVSAQALDDAQSELRLAESELRSAEEASRLAQLEHRQTVDLLNRRVLRSPFDGVVMDQYLHVGALVDPGESKKPIMKVAQTQPLQVLAMLPHRYFPSIKVGMGVTVLPEAPFSARLKASVAAVDQVIDSAAGTFGVIVKLANRWHRIPSGIRCQILL